MQEPTNALGAGTFPTDPTGLPAARATEVVELADGGRFALRIEPIAKQVGEDTLRMLGYNGSVPGPTLRVPEGGEIEIDVTNQGDLDATVHWHGLRLDNAYDGTHETQKPMAVGESFSYRVQCPDPGAYWYHPHIREDYAQELGLYGNLIVVPRDADYWAPAHREVAITLDDVLVEDGRVAGFMRDDTNYAAMGRFGNVMLAAGESDLELVAKRGEVVRFYFTDTANTRVFKVGFAGARMKLVGGDSGRHEREVFVDEVTLAPSERVVVDVLFDSEGEIALEHRTPDTTYRLGTVAVSGNVDDPEPGLAFDTLRENREFADLRERIAPKRAAAPDKSIAFVAEMDFEEPDGPVVYVCPMHPAVVSETPGSCPECGMKLMPQAVGDSEDHESHHDQEMQHHHDHGAADGIEWEDDMVEVNRTTTRRNTRWKLVDRQTGEANHDINWQFRVGDWVKIELVNEMDSDHPMHHPFHVHGAGRFLVLDRDGVEEDNLVWKDTVLITTGQTVNILLEVTNPGRWMAHCHIAEHHESGMMFSFDVLPALPQPGNAMRAVIQPAYGKPDVLELGEVDRPVAGPGEVLVRVRAAGLNIGDWHLLRGVPYVMRLIFGLRRPRKSIPGMDLAGEVEALGSGVTGFQPGDAVFGWGPGVFAEYAAVPESNLLPMPSGLTFEQAAAVGDSAFTALIAVRDQGRVQPGNSVLINGASGGVGSFAVQMAKSFGAEVTAVCSARNAELVTSLGADHVIDYTREDFTASGRRYDVMLDMIGNHPLADCRRVLTSRGTYVVVGVRDMGRWFGMARQFKAIATSPFVSQRLRVFVCRHTNADLAVLKELVEAGKVKPVIDQSYDLAEIREAFTVLGAGHARGKTVLLA